MPGDFGMGVGPAGTCEVCQTGTPARATTTPTAPARSNPLTTPRRTAKSQSRAPASTGICHRCWNERPRGMADPAMAPMTAGPAPVRNDVTVLFARIWSKRGPPTSTKTNDGVKATTVARARRRRLGGVAHDSHRQDDRTRSDLAEGDGVEELGAAHPVIGDHGVVLHERDDDESAAVGEGADLEGHPDQRAEAPDGERMDGEGGDDARAEPVGGRAARRMAISVRPQARSTRTRYGPMVAAAPPPTKA